MELCDLLNQQTEYTQIYTKDRVVQYGDLKELIESHAKNINQVKNGKTIAVYLKNSINYIVALFSILEVNSVVVPLGKGIKEVELESTLSYCGASVVITDNNNIEELLALIKKIKLEIVIYNIDTFTVMSVNSGNKCVELVDEEELINVIILIHTSGTTSSPKRVMLTEENLLSNVKSVVKSLHLNEKERTLIIMPMYLSSGLSQLLTHLYVGATIVIYDEVMLGRQICKRLLEYKITNTIMVAYGLKQILNYGECNENLEFECLNKICVAGGYTPPRFIEQFMQRFSNVALLQMYGQTEASPRITQLVERWNEKIGSIGLPIDGVKVRIVDQNKECMPYEIGEIIAKGKNIMRGYFRQKEYTKQTIVNNWLYTGDLGYFDSEGYLYIMGRKKNVIINCGMNIYPEEIEEVLVGIEGIKEAYVYGIPNEANGEDIAAKVVLDETIIKDINDIKKICVNRLANYKIPTYIEAVMQISKTLSGKILRKKGYEE